MRSFSSVLREYCSVSTVDDGNTNTVMQDTTTFAKYFWLVDNSTPRVTLGGPSNLVRGNVVHSEAGTKFVLPHRSCRVASTSQIVVASNSAHHFCATNLIMELASSCFRHPVDHRTFNNLFSRPQQRNFGHLFVRASLYHVGLCCQRGEHT